MVHDAKLTVAAAGIKTLGCHEPISHDFAMHYSFDFAQQVHYPSSPLQPGPMYFLVPRKCGIFGVCCEALPQQVNYLIDEGMCSSKGSNAVISYLHHFFSNWGLGETAVHLHCDNCSGQNKNKFMLWYFVLENYFSSASVCHIEFHDIRAHQICTGLVFWLTEAAVSSQPSLDTCRHSYSR